ncbi:MAG: ATP-dependent sacrificial sulfur transferase LarE [Desulforhopalus sp.]
MIECEPKYESLLQILRKYKKIGIAYSGGVDSTLLLQAALEALGDKNVIPLYLLSDLNSIDSVQHSREVFTGNFPGISSLREIQVDPLKWRDFVRNDDERCYQCKKRMYTVMLLTLRGENCFVLADGTNVDDLTEHRPGLRAIKELDVITPLVLAGLRKTEIRSLAKLKGLTNFNLLSNSCLATRIPRGSVINKKTLKLIEDAEQFLHQLGFEGCRVRVYDSITLVEVQAQDVDVFIQETIRMQVQQYFLSLGLGSVALKLEGRKNTLF